MEKFVGYLKLVRWPNLLFLAICMGLMQFCVVNSLLTAYETGTLMTTTESILMIVSTILIAAGGYAINDYFDVKIDAINKPKTRVVGRILERQDAMRAHQILTAIGVILGLTFSWLVRSWSMAILYLFIPGLLWFYSASYKRQFLIGNVIIAFNSALSIFMVALANAAAMKHLYGDLMDGPFGDPLYRIQILLYIWIGGFAGFAFLITLIREIIKDAEDEEGDREMECHTLPIKLGHTGMKIVVTVLIAICMIALYYLNSLMAWEDNGMSNRYITYGLILPLAILIYMLWNADCKTKFAQASGMCKFVMLIGTLYSIIIMIELIA